LKLLEELQRHDARLQDLEVLTRSLPQKLSAAENAIAELEKLLAKERADFQDTEAFRKSQEDEQKDSTDQLSRAKAKLSQVKNLKESNAAQREMEATRRQLDTREEEVQKLAAVIEEQRHKIGEHESKLDADRRELIAERNTVDKRLAELGAEISEARSQRETLAKQLRPDVLKRYGTIRMRRGLAVVAVRDGTCRGCNMNIPPQLYNTLQRGNSLELCPNCNRIIYWARLLEETVETA
jgi:predicted  nucleic acid-binding Zn-ribbon protein